MTADYQLFTNSVLAQKKTIRLLLAYLMKGMKTYPNIENSIFYRTTKQVFFSSIRLTAHETINIKPTAVNLSFTLL